MNDIWNNGMTLGAFKALMMQLFAAPPINDLELAAAYIEAMTQKVQNPTDEMPIVNAGQTIDGFDCVIGDKIITLRRELTGPVAIMAMASAPFQKEAGVHGKRFHLVKSEDTNFVLLNFGSHSKEPSAVLLDTRSEIHVPAGKSVKLQGPNVPVVLFYRTEKQ